jgi:outer membrane protein assembly factor BamB
LLCFLSLSLPAADGELAAGRLDNWHQWRGPEGNGVAPRGNPPLSWSERSNVRWKTEIPGEGHSSPIIWGDQVFVLSAERTGRAAEAPAAADGRQKTAPPRNYYRFLVTAVDRRTGKTRWQRVACEEVPHEGRHETNSYASASPSTNGRNLFVSFGSRGIYSYDLDGELKWKRDLGRMRTRFGWGEGASPAVHGDRLVVNWDQEEGSFIVALDARTGEERWKASRDEQTSWATPLVVEQGDTPQVVVNGTNKVRSYDLRTGAVIWECGGQTVNAIPSPVGADGLVVCMSGYKGSAAIAIRLDARGDVTGTDKVLWSVTRGTPYVPSPILYGDKIYFTQMNNAILSCVEAKTGRALIEGERLPELGSLYASPVGAAERIYFVDREGTTLVIRRGSKLEVLATNRIDDRVDASPAISGRQLFLRGSRHLYCLEEAPESSGRGPERPPSKS